MWMWLTFVEGKEGFKLKRSGSKDMLTFYLLWVLKSSSWNWIRVELGLIASEAAQGIQLSVNYSGQTQHFL